MEEVLETGWLAADFFLHSYRISGRVDVRRRPLADILNDRTTGFVQLEDAYISPIDRPGEIIATYAASSLTKANVTLILVPRRDDALSREQSYGSYYGTYLRQVFLTVPSLEVVGYLRLSARVDLRRLLSLKTEEFVAILDGRVRASVRPDVEFASGGVLVNKHHIGAFCLAEEE
ncbi:MAG TPA: hypothetical protein ENI39_06980 [Anaerolineae bacterium]|nr:hypothetical protein [Anaerolineae bacterium]